MAPGPSKRKAPQADSTKPVGNISHGVDLFVDAPPDKSDDSGDDTDSTVSEDSQYSDLEEEGSSDTGEESEVESIEDGSSSEEGEESDDEEEDDEEQEEEDSEEEVEHNDLKQGEEQEEGGEPVKKDSKKLQPKGGMEDKLNSGPKKGKGKRSKKVPVDHTDNKEETEVKEDSAGSSTENKTTPTEVTLQLLSKPDEYEFDSSDEEDIRNTVGNIPMEWYREFEHVGYDLEGKKIIKPKSGDHLDEFINKMENPDYWRTVTDKSTGQKVVLSDKDVELIQRLRRGRYVDPNYNQYEPWEDFFTHDVMKHPVTNTPATKASFIPSKWERLKVGRIVHAMKMGWIKPKVEKTKEEEDQQRFYMLWKPDEQPEISKRVQHHIPAPKLPLPGHAESYNPPPEYIMTEEEELAWKEQDPEDRRMNFMPKRFSRLRHVPAYSQFINERFERCLDLYLCPRMRKTRMNVDPEDLIPKLPKPRDLQPFPTITSLIYKGHNDMVRSISVSPTGQWLASGSDDQTIKFWEVSTGRCMKTVKMGDVVKKVQWNPNTAYCLVAAAVNDSVYIINPQLGDRLIQSNTDSILNSFEAPESIPESQKKLNVKWHACEDLDYDNGLRLKITHPKAVSQVSWHARGDYFAAVIPEGGAHSVILHQLLKRRSQNPFSKSKGLIQSVLFHPTRPFLIMATQRYVRVYNLLKQELMKKLMTNCKWVSSIAIHPGGDNLIVGSYDCRLSWFDLDLSAKPYQTLRHHKKAIRAASYHPKYPLFASASDDGTVIVCHGMVYNDLLQNPLIVPVKVLRGHSQTKNLNVLDCTFHPTQPWIFSSGADGTIRLYT